MVRTTLFPGLGSVSQVSDTTFPLVFRSRARTPEEPRR